MRVVDVLDPGAQLRRLAVDRGLRGAQEVRHRDAGHLDRVLHGEEQAGAGALVDGHVQHVDAVEGHRAAGDRVLRVAGDRVGQRRLAGAVRAHDRVGLARLHGQVDAAEDLLGPSSVSTATCRSVISSVAIGFSAPVSVGVSRCGHAGGRTSSDGRRRRRPCTGRQGPARWPGRPVGLPVRRSKREPCSQHSISCQPLDVALADSAIVGVRALVADREDLVVARGRARRRRRRPRRRAHLPSGDVGERAGAQEGHQAGPTAPRARCAAPTLLASSASTAAISRALDLGHADAPR